MNGVSAVVAAEMGAGDEYLVGSAPLVLTSVVVCERGGLEPALLLLCGAGEEGPYYQLRLEPGQSLAFSDAVALPWGLLLLCMSGEVAASVGYR